MTNAMLETGIGLGSDLIRDKYLGNFRKTFGMNGDWEYMKGPFGPKN